LDNVVRTQQFVVTVSFRPSKLVTTAMQTPATVAPRTAKRSIQVGSVEFQENPVFRFVEIVSLHHQKIAMMVTLSVKTAARSLA
jgi:hypothetical protein